MHKGQLGNQSESNNADIGKCFADQLSQSYKCVKSEFGKVQDKLDVRNMTAEQLIKSPWNDFDEEEKGFWAGKNYTVDWKAYMGDVRDRQSGKWARGGKLVRDMWSRGKRDRRNRGRVAPKKRAFKDWVRQRKNEAMRNGTLTEQPLMNQTSSDGR